MDDIRLIYTEYERFLSGGLKDSADRLTALMQAIPYSPLVADSHFYIKDFDNFSKQETEIISLLIKHSLSVTAAVAMCDFPSHSMIYLNEAFISLKNTVEKLESEGQLDPADVSFYFGSEMEERESFLFSYLMNANIARVVPKTFSRAFHYTARLPKPRKFPFLRSISTPVSERAPFTAILQWSPEILQNTLQP